MRERFESKFIKDAGGCWLWTAGGAKDDYGRFRVDGRIIKSHRAAYEFYVGQIPPGLFVCHTCDIRRCVNPAHLWTGTQADNMSDKKNKGRAARHLGDRNGARTHPDRVARGDNNGARLYPERLARGEQNGSAKLTAADVLTIRAAVGMTQQHLCLKYGVSQNQISRILRGKNWTHLLPPGNSNEAEFKLAAQLAAGVPVAGV